MKMQVQCGTVKRPNIQNLWCDPLTLTAALPVKCNFRVEKKKVQLEHLQPQLKLSKTDHLQSSIAVTLPIKHQTHIYTLSKVGKTITFSYL